MRKNGLLPEGREERGAGVGGEEGREGGKKGIVRQLCSLSLGAHTSPCLWCLEFTWKEKVATQSPGSCPPCPWWCPVPGLDLLSALSLPCSPWQPTNEEVLLGAIQGVGASQEPRQASEHGQAGVSKTDAVPLLLP